MEMGLDTVRLAIECVESKSVGRTRAALILLDGLTESLILFHAQTLFAKERAFEWIARPSIDVQTRSKILWQFPPKLRFAEGPQLQLSQWHVACLEIAHDYRNYVQHRNDYREGALRALTALLLDAVAELLRKTYAQLSIEDLVVLCDRMAAAVPAPVVQLHADLVSHSSEVGERLVHLFGRHEPLDVANELGRQEFLLTHEAHRAFLDIQSMHYEISEGKPPERPTYDVARFLAEDSIREAFNKFQPRMTLERFRDAWIQIRRISAGSEDSSMLLSCGELRKFLGEFEDYLNAAEYELGRRDWLEEDIRRGK